MPQILAGRGSLRERLASFAEECVRDGIRFKDALCQFEMEYIMIVLGQTGYNVSKAAKILGINRNTLSKKIEEFQQYEIFRKHRHHQTSR